MSLYFYDSIVGTAPGPGFPPGFSGNSATVEPYSNDGAFSPHNWLQFVGNLNAALTTGVSNFTAWFAWQNTGFSQSGTIFQSVGTLINGQQTATAILKVENDNTLSCYVAGSPNVLVFNSGSLVNPYPFIMQQNVWYFFQVGIKLFTTHIGSVNFLSAEFSIYVDGFQLCSGTQGISNFYLDTSFQSNSFAGSLVTWSQPNGSGPCGVGETYVGGYSTSLVYPGNLWSLIIDNPGSGYLGGNTLSPSSGDATLGFTIGASGQITSIFPISPNYLGDSNTGTITLSISSGTGSGFSGHATLAPNPNRRISQTLVESSHKPTTANIRAPQLVIEHAYAPSNAHIRIPQMVIELPLNRSAQAGGWIVKEC